MRTSTVFTVAFLAVINGANALSVSIGTSLDNLALALPSTTTMVTTDGTSETRLYFKFSEAVTPRQDWIIPSVATIPVNVMDFKVLAVDDTTFQVSLSPTGGTTFRLRVRPGEIRSAADGSSLSGEVLVQISGPLAIQE